jgi:restriction system protein
MTPSGGSSRSSRPELTRVPGQRRCRPTRQLRPTWRPRVPASIFERASLDRIQAFIAEHFAGHGLARLVGAVLEAEGFRCQVADPGPDGGIDVFAGRGPLGLDSPRLIVQVKSSPTPVDVKVVRELHGVLSTHGAEQALLVAWGGVNKAAKQELRNQFFKVRV